MHSAHKIDRICRVFTHAAGKMNTTGPPSHSEEPTVDSIHLRRHYSRNTIFRMIIIALLGAALLFWKADLINSVYFKNQLTSVGLAVNGAILALFVLGLLRMIAILMSYMREEAAIIKFVNNIEARPDQSPLKNVNENSMMVRRYNTMRILHDARSPINQNALASTLVASESTRNSLPKFINNILILGGVFGTIISLSIALLGASDVLEDAVNTGGMGMVIHGMSTALSTTITAIICYLYFGYFYLRLMDAQTNIVSAVEQVTTTHLMPKFQIQTDSVLYEFTGLIRSLQGLVAQMESTQESFVAMENDISETLNTYREKIEGMDKYMDTIIHYLRLGFRLRDDE